MLDYHHVVEIPWLIFVNQCFLNINTFCVKSKKSVKTGSGSRGAEAWERHSQPVRPGPCSRLRRGQPRGPGSWLHLRTGEMPLVQAGVMTRVKSWVGWPLVKAVAGIGS